MYLLSSPFYVLAAVSWSLVFPALSPNAWFFYSSPRFLEFGDGGVETSRPVNLRIHMFGNWCRFFFAICDVFFIYIFHCVFSLSIFFLCLANSFTHIYRGLWRRQRQWVSGFFYYYYFYLVICLNSGFLGKYYFYFLFWLKIFFFSFLFTLYLYQSWLVCVALP